jgi:hypothetical protein
MMEMLAFMICPNPISKIPNADLITPAWEVFASRNNKW